MKIELYKQLKKHGFPEKKLATLPNLIEECGDNFISLTRDVEGGLVVWIAEGPEESFRDDAPDDAVIRLWLAYNPR